MKNEKPAPSGAGTFEESIDRRPEKSAEKEAAAQAGKKYISPPPLHGIHQWMMKAAWQARRAKLSAEETVEAMYAHEEGARRRFEPVEVESAVEKVFNTEVVSGRKKKSRAPEVIYNPEKAEAVAKAWPFDLDHFKVGSVEPEPWELEPSELLGGLFC